MPVRLKPDVENHESHYRTVSHMQVASLTGKGMQQLYALGANVRDQYVINASVVPELFDTNFVYMRASDSSRTLQVGIVVYSVPHTPTRVIITKIVIYHQSLPNHTDRPHSTCSLLAPSGLACSLLGQDLRTTTRRFLRLCLSTQVISFNPAVCLCIT